MKVQGLFLAVAGVLSLTPLPGEQPRIAPVQLTPPGDTGRRVTEDGLFGNYFPAATRAPALLMLGGSAGGLVLETNRAAIALQAERFTTLHLSYFRAPGQNTRVELIPLEYFGKALQWMRRQPDVDPERLAIFGSSKGSEAALLIAVRHPELKAVIAAMPTSVVWPGVVWEGSPTKVDSSWSESGASLRHLPHVPYDASKGTMAENYQRSLNAFDDHPEAVIPVERIGGAIMAVCAEADTAWPNCVTARQIERRLAAHRRPAPLREGDPRLNGGGGSPQATNAARADSWPKAVAFLKTHMSK